MGSRASTCSRRDRTTRPSATMFILAIVSRMTLLTNWPIGSNVVRRVDVTFIDLVFWNELVDVDRARALDLDGLDLLVLDDHVVALGDLIAAHSVLPRNNLAGFGIDVLLF